MATSTIWISYDLGVGGDYEGLYSWLNSYGAKECGDSLAVITYEFRHEIIDELKIDISTNLRTDKRTRIYVIHRDRSTDRNKGTFIFGGRRAPPWSGYAGSQSDTADDEIEN